MPPDGLGNKSLNDTLTIFYAHSKPHHLDIRKFMEKNYPNELARMDSTLTANEALIDSLGNTDISPDDRYRRRELRYQNQQIEDKMDSIGMANLPGNFEAQANYQLANKNLKKQFGHIQAFPIGEDPITGDTVTRQNVDKAKIGPNTTVQIIDHSGGSKDRYGAEEGGFWKEALCDAESVALGTCNAPLYAQQFANTIEKPVTSQGYDAFWSGINPYAKDFESSIAFKGAATELSDDESVVKTYQPGELPTTKQAIINRTIRTRVPSAEEREEEERTRSSNSVVSGLFGGSR